MLLSRAAHFPSTRSISNSLQRAYRRMPLACKQARWPTPEFGPDRAKARIDPSIRANRTRAPPRSHAPRLQAPAPVDPTCPELDLVDPPVPCPAPYAQDAELPYSRGWPRQGPYPARSCPYHDRQAESLNLHRFLGDIPWLNTGQDICRSDCPARSRSGLDSHWPPYVSQCCFGKQLSRHQPPWPTTCVQQNGFCPHGHRPAVDEKRGNRRVNAPTPGPL